MNWFPSQSRLNSKVSAVSLPLYIASVHTDRGCGMIKALAITKGWRTACGLGTHCCCWTLFHCGAQMLSTMKASACTATFCISHKARQGWGLLGPWQPQVWSSAEWSHGGYPFPFLPSPQSTLYWRQEAVCIEKVRENELIFYLPHQRYNVMLLPCSVSNGLI